MVLRFCRVFLLLPASLSVMAAQSIYTKRMDDPSAVYLTHDKFGVVGDGVNDDSDGLQNAINEIQTKVHHGVVYVPEGRYRLGKTVFVWAGVRIIGYGVNRPVFVLGKDTPGFQDGNKDYLLWFAGHRAKVGDPFRDGDFITFFSGMQNVDIQIMEGNPAAVAVRFYVAQLCVLAHLNLDIGSARAGIEGVGNIAYDIHIKGGRYGIIAGTTPPGWQFTLMDSSIEAQTQAALQDTGAGLTLIRDRIAHVPVAVEIGKGHADMFYAQDVQLEDIKNVAIIPGDKDKAHEQMTLQNILCRNVPTLMNSDDGSEATVSAPAENYVVDHLSYGLEIQEDGREGTVALRQTLRPLTQPAVPVASDIPALPPMDRWINVHTLGVKGDGVTDDAEALQSAIEKNKVLFLPTGKYRLSHSLVLRTETVLIGMNSGATELDFDNDSTDLRGDGPPVAVLNAPPGGKNIVTGLQICVGLRNPRASAISWKAGPSSMLDDVQSSPPVISSHTGGQGTSKNSFEIDPPASPSPGIVVSDGGGGVFRNIWINASWASATPVRAGFLVENTSTPGHVYELSCEHHTQNEVQFHSVSNWEVVALQTEEDPGQAVGATSLELLNVHDLIFANLFQYRASRSLLPAVNASLSQNSTNICFENVHCTSRSPFVFDNTFSAPDRQMAVRTHNFGTFVLNGKTNSVPALPLPGGIFADGSKLVPIMTGFKNATSLTADNEGNVYFTDAHEKKIYSWSEGFPEETVLVQDASLSPVVMTFVPPASLVGVTLENTVFSVSQGNGNKLEPVSPSKEYGRIRSLIFPVGDRKSLQSILTPNTKGKLYLPSGTETALEGVSPWGVLTQSCQLAVFPLNSEHYAVSDEDEKVYLLKRDGNGELHASVFANRGGTSVVPDQDGNVYVADGQIYIYDKAGKQLGTLEVPERPSSLCIGGRRSDLLLIGARTSIYAIRLAKAGRGSGLP